MRASANRCNCRIARAVVRYSHARTLRILPFFCEDCVMIFRARGWVVLCLLLISLTPFPLRDEAMAQQRRSPRALEREAARRPEYYKTIQSRTDTQDVTRVVFRNGLT